MPGGAKEPRMPRFSDLFMLLTQLEIAPDVTFIRYPSVHRYAGIDEALADCRALIGDDWDETRARSILGEVLTEVGGELVFDGGLTLVGIAHWQPRTA
jgi:hypothetical protein